MITKLIRWIIRQIDKTRGRTDSCTQWGRGKWYVQYKDDERSMTMYYQTACEYAEMFGGKVKHIGDMENSKTKDE